MVDLVHQKCHGDSYFGFADLSEALLIYISDIEWLSQMPGGLAKAYQTILYLGSHSFYDYYNTYVYAARHASLRTSDRPADILLLDILKRLKQEDQHFVPGEEFKELKADVEKFASGGAYMYFPMSYSLMLSWIEGPEAAQKAYEELKTKISVVNTKHEAKIHETRQKLVRAKTSKGESSMYEHLLTGLSRDMVEFVPLIRRLAFMENGLSQAFTLILFLGRQSYPISTQ